ncbi:MAG: hypothetical protein K2Y51_15260 [Gammaproteobacteria bacterium]|nr:hypothetical protein [Gammaproteobacteria bacterium]
MKQIFALPAVIGASTLAALLLALLDEGLVDHIAAVTLIVPLATLHWALTRARRDED